MANENLNIGPQWYDPTGGKGSLGSLFGQKPRNPGQWSGKGVHTGTDYRIGANSSAYSLSGGKVTASGFDPTVGNYVTVEVSPGKSFTYEHLNKLSVKKGQVVRGGEQLGLTGNTGSSSRGAHLHTEYVVNGALVSPESFYGKSIPSWAKGSSVQGAPQSLGKAFQYKGSAPVNYTGKGYTKQVSSNAGPVKTTIGMSPSVSAPSTAAFNTGNLFGKIF